MYALGTKYANINLNFQEVNEDVTKFGLKLKTRQMFFIEKILLTTNDE
jgi:hypothetical protein